MPKSVANGSTQSQSVRSQSYTPGKVPHGREDLCLTKLRMNGHEYTAVAVEHASSEAGATTLIHKPGENSCSEKAKKTAYIFGGLGLAAVSIGVISYIASRGGTEGVVQARGGNISASTSSPLDITSPAATTTSIPTVIATVAPHPSANATQTTSPNEMLPTTITNEMVSNSSSPTSDVFPSNSSTIASTISASSSPVASTRVSASPETTQATTMSPEIDRAAVQHDMKNMFTIIVFDNRDNYKAFFKVGNHGDPNPITTGYADESGFGVVGVPLQEDWGKCYLKWTEKGSSFENANYKTIPLTPYQDHKFLLIEGDQLLSKGSINNATTTRDVIASLESIGKDLPDKDKIDLYTFFIRGLPGNGQAQMRDPGNQKQTLREKYVQEVRNLKKST